MMPNLSWAHGVSKGQKPRTAIQVGVGAFFFALPFLIDIALWFALPQSLALIVALALLDFPLAFTCWLIGASLWAVA